MSEDNTEEPTIEVEDQDEMRLTICVDFDGTIVKHMYPELGDPVPLALEVLKACNRVKIDLILYTMRSGKELQDAIDYLDKNGINILSANSNPTQSSWTSSPKVYGNLYIDDAAMGCPLIMPSDGGRSFVDWQVIQEMLLHITSSSVFLPSKSSNLGITVH